MYWMTFKRRTISVSSEGGATTRSSQCPPGQNGIIIKAVIFGFLVIGSQFLFGCLASARAADAVAERMVSIFKRWGAENNFTRANIAIVRNGRLIEQAAHGRTAVDTQHPIASLSKSITGICVMKLVEAGHLRYDARIGDVLAAFLGRNGRPVDARLPSITIQQLLTQSSGMTDDMIRGADGHASLWAIARLALTRPLGANPGERHSYTNLNYVFLDAIIETVTGESYEAACRRLVLAPVGARNARLYYGGLRPRPTWVDWQMSAGEFARFMAYFDRSSGLLTAAVEQWPKIELSKTSAYSIGVVLRRASNGFTFTHNGGFSWTANGRTDNYASFFVYWYTGLGYVVTFSPSNDRARDELERRLWAASQASFDPSTSGAEREPRTNRPGSDYRSLTLPRADVELCLNACKADTRCRAYTYVAPGFQGPNARCWLKFNAPQSHSDNCCTSGVIR